MKKSKLRQVLQFVLFFGLGLALIYWQFSGFTVKQREDFFTALQTANYKWFALAVLVGALAHLSRAIRWQQLLHPLGKKAGLGNRFYAVMIGYLANYGLPRSGEIIRSGLLLESDSVPFSEAFGTVVVERIVDFLCLVIVFLLVLLFEFSQLQTLWIQYIWDPALLKFSALAANKTTLIILISGVFLFFGALIFFRKKIGKFFTGKLGTFFTGFKNGILGVRKVPNPGWFIFHSIFIWACYLTSLYLCFFCFPITSSLTINDALAILLFGTFGVIFTPGGIGLYQIIVTGIVAFLLHLKVPSDVASFAWLTWGSQVITVIIFCGIAVAIKPLLNRVKK
ncbi:MAG: lysylphosphatidylglycerol synthase transmembrane domain-containing protein [Bacteroidetes bacterium]|nr:lysylphosphatidylglycerol synthase transmembrane domain-containing protein [Bacteroidota bacterium]